AAERLFKSGVLARAEVEQRGLRVIRLQSLLANARMVRAKEYADSQHSRAASGEISKAELAESEQLLNRAIEEARLAGTSRDKAEVDAAEMNLRRQQKLLQLGSAR